MRNSPPPSGKVTTLPAGKTLTVELACNVGYTTIGGASLDANDPCPDNTGALHAGVPGEPVDHSLLAGCALAIADVEEIADVTMDNLVCSPSSSSTTCTC